MPADAPILLVEDSDEDYETLCRAFRVLDVRVPIVRCADGDAALACLLPADPSRRMHPLPRLILLDLNLPGTSGHDVLHAIKHDATLRAIPLLVLTSSAAPADVHASYLNGANSYLVKPVGFEQYTRLVDDTRQFWMRAATLPSFR